MSYLMSYVKSFLSILSIFVGINKDKRQDKIDFIQTKDVKQKSEGDENG